MRLRRFDFVGGNETVLVYVSGFNKISTFLFIVYHFLKISFVYSIAIFTTWFFLQRRITLCAEERKPSCQIMYEIFLRFVLSGRWPPMIRRKRLFPGVQIGGPFLTRGFAILFMYELREMLCPISILILLLLQIIMYYF